MEPLNADDPPPKTDQPSASANLITDSSDVTGTGTGLLSDASNSYYETRAQLPETGMPATSSLPAVPGYAIKAVVGRGGMGVVYKAVHLTLKRTVALKMMLSGSYAGTSELARFHIEAEAAARLQHPNIVQIHEVGEANGHPYCALEFVEGGNLASRLEDKPMPARESAQLVETLARAMQLAHSRNIVHRDLKPANVLLTADGTPKITDFGLARQLDSDSGATLAGEVMGTPSYMAPEQAAGQAHDAGPAADVYALGAILYNCLAGRPPFKGKNVVETLDRVRTQEAVPPSRWQARVPLDLDTICLKCLRKEPEKRYASAAELADDLVRYQRGEPILARPVGRIERTVKWVKRNPVVTVATLAVALALALGATVSYLKYIDAQQQKGIAEVQKQEALKEADKAKKARDFLISIFRISETDILGGNVTAREIVADAEKRIPAEFADQPELQQELAAAIDEVNRNIGRNIPAAMILESSGSIQIRSARGQARQSQAQVLLFPEDRLELAADGRIRLYFLSDLHQEWLKPGSKANINRKGCEPSDAVSKRENDFLMNFVRIPKGTFYMGWDGKNKGTKTEIMEDFEIAVHTVTQGQWQAIMGSNPSEFSRRGTHSDSVKAISDEELQLFPVEHISIEEMREFIKKLNERERHRGYLYRLPAEEEWEYACRGGAHSEDECSYRFYFAKPTNELSYDMANFDNQPGALSTKALGRPSRVGSYPANKLGLHDMHGNIIQCCTERGASSPIGRGGCFANDADHCGAAKRLTIGTKSPVVGLRLVRVPVQ